MLLYIILAVVLALAAIGLFIFLSLRYKPTLLLPVTNLLFKSKRVKTAAQGQMAKQMAANPEMLEEALSGQVSKEQMKQINNVFGNRTEADREKMLSTMMEAAESGRTLKASDLARTAPLTGDEARARNIRKSANRSKSKAARKQRKRQRKR